ncbi:MAG: sialate O-acetylesterase [Lewinella sp.]|nr:sialate O-acetylesterase [Lewinella sp.]
MPTRIRLITMLVLACLSSAPLAANLTLPAIFSDHMVLQRNAEVTIWGWGKAQEPVKLSASWAPGEVWEQQIGPLGRWSFTITTPDEAGPFSLDIQGYNQLRIEDVLLGEVWLCSGQSNMEWSVNLGIDEGEAEAAAADYPEIRLFTVRHKTSDFPQDDLPGEWVKCSPATIRDFSAVGYFFGRHLHQELDVPVGLILSAWGGTPAEVWLSADRVRSDRLLREAAATLQPQPWGPKDPGLAFDAMLCPLAPYRIAGALWYQGESNTGYPQTYARLLETLIDDWRARWGYDFPFYIAQIAPYAGYGDDNIRGGILRDQQRRVVAATEDTGLVVVADIGDLDNIHPTNKQDVGLRFARLALARQYGFELGLVEGPLYQRHEQSGNELTVYFSQAEGGLVADGPLTGFELAGPDGQFHPAEARIQGETVVLHSAAVPLPQYLHYAMGNTAVHSLFNRAGLPASCFTTE